ncbi:MAG: hypothetical protein U1F34_07130 [Gammaproteobacteria bacterium]
MQPVQSGLALLLISAVVYGADHDTPPAKDATVATHECASGATIYSEVPLHTGVANERVVAVQPIGTLKFPTGYEGGQYADCLKREGVTRDVAKDPYFERLEACRAKARGGISVTEEEAASSAIGKTDDAAVAACMRGEPASPTPKPANETRKIRVDVDQP